MAKRLEESLYRNAKSFKEYLKQCWAESQPAKLIVAKKNLGGVAGKPKGGPQTPAQRRAANADPWRVTITLPAS